METLRCNDIQSQRSFVRRFSLTCLKAADGTSISLKHLLFVSLQFPVNPSALRKSSIVLLPTVRDESAAAAFNLADIPWKAVILLSLFFSLSLSARVRETRVAIYFTASFTSVGYRVVVTSSTNTRFLSNHFITRRKSKERSVLTRIALHSNYQTSNESQSPPTGRRTALLFRARTFPLDFPQFHRAP